MAEGLRGAGKGACGVGGEGLSVFGYIHKREGLTVSIKGLQMRWKV